MRTVIYTLFGAGFTIATAWAIGSLLLRKLRTSFSRAEEHLLAFVIGSVGLSLLVLALSALGLARKGIFLAVGAVLILLAIRFRSHRPQREEAPSASRKWWLLFLLVMAPLTMAYLFLDLQPQLVQDSLTYRLSLIGRAHGLAGNESLTKPDEA